jgi:hypothetical protein
MMRGLAEGLLDDLWNFPAAFGASPAEALAALRQKLARLASAPPAPVTARPDGLLHGASRKGSPPFRLGEPLAEFRHNITFRTIKGYVYPVSYSRGIRHASLHWFELTDLPHAAISQLARKIVKLVTPYDPR